MKKIPLNRGKFAIVDDEDFRYLSRFKWCAVPTKGDEKVCYAVAKIPRISGGQISLSMVNLLISSKRGYRICHKNECGLDNRKSNLILLPMSFSQHKDHKFKRECSSEYKGVTLKKDGKWEAYINKGFRHYYLGRFTSEIDAAMAYNKKAKELYGNLAYQNKI